MGNPIIISNLNDFIFCPASIYFHNIYGQQDRRLYQSEKQLNDTKVHETVDEAKNNKNACMQWTYIAGCFTRCFI